MVGTLLGIGLGLGAIAASWRWPLLGRLFTLIVVVGFIVAGIVAMLRDDPAHVWAAYFAMAFAMERMTADN